MTQQLLPRIATIIAIVATLLVGCSEEAPVGDSSDDVSEIARADLSGVEITVHYEPG